MPLRPRLLPALAGLAGFAGSLLAAGAARAQTVQASGQPYPDRIVNGTDVGSSERPQNQNPLGISYSDCARGMTLHFNLTATGLTSGQQVQVWATRAGDCTSQSSRGIGGIATCWQAAQASQPIVASTPTPVPFDVRVQDLVAAVDLSNQTALIHHGIETCSSQAGFSPVNTTLWFLPVDSAGNAIGTPYQFPISVDLVGPPAPTGVSITYGDTLLTLHWTPNFDSDTTGYDLYIDPAQGATASTPDAAAPGADASYNVLVCPDTGPPASSDASPDTGDDGAADATSGPEASTGCSNMPPPPPSSAVAAGSCGSTVLAQGFVAEAGAPVTVPDDSGVDGAVTTISSGGGGISQIPTANLVNPDSRTGVTISSKAVSSYTISGLKNGLPGYTVVIAGVDGFGNVGPPSVQKCDFPAPVTDFYEAYGLAGGRAGGGFCTLEAAGEPVGLSVVALPALAALVGLARRRKRRSP
jgi:hypothetical protein